MDTSHYFMMCRKLLFSILFLIPIAGLTHPGVGIVKDSKGNIYYTDLNRVWKITNGERTVIIPNVHTHELYVDKNDNLFGEGGYYDDNTKKFYHYLWKRSPTGKIDTVVGMRQAYIEQDFSLARDRNGNEYYLKSFLQKPDTNHIYRKTPGGKEEVFATGNFKGVSWLHVQENGTLLFTKQNAIYKVEQNGKIKLIKAHVANAKPSYSFSKNNVMLWGVWQDKKENIYVAAFSDQAVKKIDTYGRITEVYRSKNNWTPLHGVFDDDGKLWVLETSDKNDVRVVAAATMSASDIPKKSSVLNYILLNLNDIH